MGIGVWFRNLFSNNNVEEIVCPKCGSKDFSYIMHLANFVEVMRGTEPARYVKSGTCNSCGYRMNDTEGT